MGPVLVIVCCRQMHVDFVCSFLCFVFCLLKHALSLCVEIAAHRLNIVAQLLMYVVADGVLNLSLLACVIVLVPNLHLG